MTQSNRWVALGLAIIAGAGVAISAYLTSVHYADVPLACTSTGVVNCEQVLTSTYSSVAGIPWAAGGIAWFGVAWLLALVQLWRSPEPGWLQPAQVGWSLLGLAVVLYLVGVELLAVHRLCLWCTAMHGLIVVTFLVSVLRTPETEPA